MLHLIIQTGVYPDNVLEWNNLDKNDKMFPDIITHFADAEISQHQLLGMKRPDVQNIQQQAYDLSIKAKLIAAAAAESNAENVTQHEEKQNCTQTFAYIKSTSA